VTLDEGKFLGWLAGRVPENGLIVEIGTLYGRSMSFLALGSSDSVRLYAVDCWEDYHRMVKAVEYLTKLGVIDRIKIIKGYSVDVAKSFNGEIDMLFIDGNHSYESVKADYESWHPFLRKGGIVAFHDCIMPKYPGVCKVVDEIASKENDYIAQVGKVWSGQKR